MNATQAAHPTLVIPNDKNGWAVFERPDGLRVACDMILATRLTKSETAFPGFGDFRHAMDNGYVPTIRGTTPNEKLLIRVLRSIGYRVWGAPGGKFW